MVLAFVTRRGMLLPKVLYFGPKQGPGIFQSFVDSVFNRIVGDDDEEFLSVFVDSTRGHFPLRNLHSKESSRGGLGHGASARNHF